MTSEIIQVPVKVYVHFQFCESGK